MWQNEDSEEHPPARQDQSGARGPDLSAAQEAAPSRRPLPELPPVEPPSGGFIVQLFVVPALIVFAIFGTWWMIDRMSRREQDWKPLVQDLRSNNEHTRWRAAFGLAQLLQSSQQPAAGAGKAEGNLPAASDRLVVSREAAQELANLLVQELKHQAPTSEQLKQQEFLTLALAQFHLPDVVLPAIRQAMQPAVDTTVRKNALAAAAIVLSRARDQERNVDETGLIDDLLEASKAEEVVIRQLAAYTLGLSNDKQAERRLLILLEDGSRSVQANAAIALARNHNTSGLRVLKRMLSAQADPQGSPDDALEPFLALQNGIRAVELLSDDFDAAQRREVLELLDAVVKTTTDPRIEVDARRAAAALRQSDR